MNQGTKPSLFHSQIESKGGYEYNPDHIPLIVFGSGFSKYHFEYLNDSNNENIHFHNLENHFKVYYIKELNHSNSMNF